MLVHNTTSVLFVAEKETSILNPLISYLERIPHIRLETAPCLPDSLDSWQVIVTVGASALSDQWNPLPTAPEAGTPLHSVDRASGPHQARG